MKKRKGKAWIHLNQPRIIQRFQIKVLESGGRIISAVVDDNFLVLEYEL